jgi:hypothetical protein
MIFTVKESNQPKKQQQNGNTTKSCVCDDSSESPRGLFFLFCLMNSNDTHTGHTTTLTVGPLRAPKVRGGLLFLLLVTVTVVSHNKSYKTVKRLKTTNPLRSKARTLQQASKQRLINESRTMTTNNKQQRDAWTPGVVVASKQRCRAGGRGVPPSRACSPWSLPARARAAVGQSG